MNADIKTFLSETKDIYFGYSEINFCKPENLFEAQIGFKYDENGTQLIDTSWKESWIIIANDNLGDPIFVDESLPNLPVFTAQHGEENWSEIKIADSLNNFKEIILKLKEISKHRENPVELEQNPISKIETDNFLKEIESKNQIDSWWWELFIETEDEDE